MRPEGHPAVHGFVAAVGDKIVEALGVRAAHELDPKIDARFARYAGASQHRFEICPQQENPRADGCAPRLFALEFQAGDGLLKFPAAPFQIREARNVGRHRLLNQNRRAVARQVEELFQGCFRHELRIRNQDHAVAVSIQQDFAVANRRLPREAIGQHIVAIAVFPEKIRVATDRVCAEPAIGLFDGEGQEQVAGSLPEIVDGKVQQHVVGGRAALQDGLAAGDVGVEEGQVAPETALGTKIDCRIKLPARPGRLGRRIRNAVKEQMVCAGKEQVIRRVLGLRQRGLEMIRQPRERFRGRPFAPARVRRGGGKLVHQYILFAETAKDLRFRDVRRGVKVHEICGSAVRLIAGEIAATVRPVRPAPDPVDVQIGDRLAVILLHAVHDPGIAVAGQGGQPGAQIVAAAFPELVEKVRRPIGLVILE